MTKTIGIYLFDDVEVLDFAGPFEVFSTAARVEARTSSGAGPLFAVALIGAHPGTILARGGLVVSPAYDIRRHPPVNVLIVPGGVVDRELERAGLGEWLRRVSASAELTASVCTGAFLLAQAGLLNGRRATTHWEDLDDFRRRFPDIEAVSGERWTGDGEVYTSAGISAGIDLSLNLVARLAGRDLALRTARQMEYAWDGATDAGSGEDRLPTSR